MFLEYLPKARVVEVLIVLQQYQAEIELAEGQFQLLHLPSRNGLFVTATFVLYRVEVRLEFRLQCRELSRSLR